VRQWLGQVMQVAQQLGLPGADGEAVPAAGEDSGQEPPGAPADPGMVEARQAMERGDLGAAAGAFERMLSASPGDPVATMGLGQVNLLRRVQSYDQAQARRDAAAHPDDVDAQAKVADIDLATGKTSEAFDRLLGVIRRTSGEDRDKARRHLISLFEIFPPRDPQVAKARSALSSLLF
jgi:putative thioredoxin